VTPPTIGDFAGFPSDAFAFFAELGDDANNSRAWFDDNRGRYERSVRLPMEELLAGVAAEFGDDGKVFRPNRDVRFSADKRPYKTHCGAVIGFRDGTQRASWYLHVDADGLFVAAGYHELSRDQRDRFRRAVDDPRTGGSLVRAVGQVSAAGLEVAGSELTRAPRGYPVDHPRIELLRHLRLTAQRRFPRGTDGLHGPEARDLVVGTWRAATPVCRWLERHVGAPADPPRRRGGR
jgi:uncharacterized protein (TIGR02453 family)